MIWVSAGELKEIFEPTFTHIAALVQEHVDAAQQATNKNVDVCASSSESVLESESSSDEGKGVVLFMHWH